MKKKFKRILALALSVMMVLSLAACGNSNTGNSNTTNGSAQTDAGTSAAAFEATTASNLENVIDAARDNQSGSVTGDTAAPVQQEPSSRGETTIVTTIASDPGGFDLALSNSMNTEYGIYQSLLTYGYNGYEPGIWSDYEIADDGMSISFTIDDNIFTTDGYHITADDVIWSIGLHKDGICANYASIFDMETSKSTGDYTGVLGLSSEFYPFMLDQCCHLGVTSQEGYEKSEDHYYYRKSKKRKV